MVPLPTDISLMRIIAQGLIPATAAESMEAVARYSLALQGQQVSAIPHAFLARQPGARLADVHAAFNEGMLVRSWPMRGTVHVTSAHDHHWLRVATVHRYDRWWADAREKHGVTDALLQRAADIALAEIAASGPVRRERLIDLWVAEGLLQLGTPVKKGATMDEAWVQTSRRRRLILLLHLAGLVVQGPVGTNEHLIVDARTLPDERSGPGGGEGVAYGESGHQAAMTEIARRYATSHGPICVADLARWLAFPVGQSAAALEAAVEDSAGSSVPLVRMRVDEGGKLVEYVAPLSARERTAHALYMRADLCDLLEAHRDEAMGTFYLGMFDELHVGYKDRSCMADEVAEQLICPGKNGMFQPFVCDRGRVVAVTRAQSGIHWVGGAAPSKRVEKAAGQVIDQIRHRLSGR
ncbi:MAG: crosslink repair DNA glycosylase YcaQ family protein [Actinomycetaceae bacterium]|nr:crosslink repair DNA glycosylase YcaQ family protein [Actinomycetaceae bacterium]